MQTVQTRIIARPRLTIAVAIFAIAAMASAGLVWGIARAQTPEQTIYACVSGNGSVRIVDDHTQCRGGETPLSWNREGEPGPVGPAGPEGPQGPQGEPGEVEVNVNLQDGSGPSPSGTAHMFLKIEGIPGESRDSAHEGEIDVLSWSWGASSSATTHVGGGAGAGKANFQDLAITKPVDKASPKLVEALAKGTHITGEVVLTVRGASDDPKQSDDYLVIKLENVIVTSVATGASSGEDHPTESISLNFSKVSVTYTERTDDGSPGETVEFGWDIAANTSQ